MSQENVERIRRAFDAFNRRDLDASSRSLTLRWSSLRATWEMEGDPHGRCEFCVTRLEREQQSPTIDERHSSVVAGLQAENSHA